MARQIFRQEALDRLSSPEQLDQLVELTSPRSWIALATVGFLIGATLLWAWFGTIPTTAKAKGILLRKNGITTLEAPAAGIVTAVKVLPGDTVEKDQPLLVLTPSEAGLAKSILSPFRGRVLERRIPEGGRVKKGDIMLKLEPLDKPLRAHLFVPLSEGYQIQAGMEVHIWPTQVKNSGYGYVLGKVLGAFKLAVSHEEMMTIVNNEELVRQISETGPCLQVFVELLRDSETESGFRWSSAHGAPVQLYHGSPCEARIIISEQQPIQLVFPALGAKREP